MCLVKSLVKRVSIEDEYFFLKKGKEGGEEACKNYLARYFDISPQKILVILFTFFQAGPWQI